MEEDRVLVGHFELHHAERIARPRLLHDRDIAVRALGREQGTQVRLAEGVDELGAEEGHDDVIAHAVHRLGHAGDELGARQRRGLRPAQPGRVGSGRAQHGQQAAVEGVAATAPGHAHQDMCEVFFVEAGQGNICIDGTDYALTPGVCVAVEPGEVHEVSNPGQEELVLTYFGLRVEMAVVI